MDKLVIKWQTFVPIGLGLSRLLEYGRNSVLATNIYMFATTSL